MSLEIPPGVAGKLQSIEREIEPFDAFDIARVLEESVGDIDAITPGQRLGCVAEILCWKFMPMRTLDRQPWGSYFGPVFSGTAEDGRQVHQPDARAVPKVVIEHWARRSAESAHPLIRARHGDLAWEFIPLWNQARADDRIERPRELAQRTIDAYLQSVADGLSGEGHHAWLHLARALELSLLVKDKERIEKAKHAAFSYARATQGQPNSGHWWNLHALMWDAKGVAMSDAERGELMGWLGQALDQHADSSDPGRFDPHRATDAAEMLRLWHGKLGNHQAGVAAVKKAGDAFEAMAARADPLTAIAWLEDLSAKYRRDKLPEDATRVEAGIRSRAQAAESAMVRHEVQYQIPPEQMEAWLGGLLEGSAARSLVRIAASFMRSEGELEALLLKSAEQAPLMARIAIAITGPQGFTTARIGSIEDDMPGRIVHLASNLIGQEAPLLNVAFERAKAVWQLGADNLIAWLIESPLFAPMGHGLLRQGLNAWEQGDFVKAAHLLVPQVESAVREWMFALGESPMKFNGRDGGFESQGLGEMLNSKAFREGVHPVLRHHLRCLYVHPKGLNLRNRLAHGWAGEELANRGMANWVVHSLIAIRVYSALPAADAAG